MTYVGVEFTENGAIGLVHSSWFTPLKNDVFWPPYKTSSSFNRALTNAEEPDELSWTLNAIKRCFFECDSFEKAHKKLKKCEDTSDVQTTTESSDFEDRRPKRQIKKKRFQFDSSSDGDNDSTLAIRPPSFGLLKKSGNYKKSSSPLHATQTSDALKTQASNIPSNLQTSPVPYARKINSTTLGVATSSVLFSGAENESQPTKASTEATITVNRVGLEKIFLEVKKLREEVKEIKGLLKQSRTNIATGLPSDLPIEFPLITKASFMIFEEYTNEKEKRDELASYFSTLGGSGITGHVNRILKLVMSNNLASQYNFAGQRAKQAFNGTNLKMIIICAMQMKYPASTEAEIETSIKIWLKHAKQRMQRKQGSQKE